MTTSTVASPENTDATRPAPLVRLSRAELRWIFRRPRNLIALGLLALIPVGVGVSFLFAEPSGSASAGPGAGVMAAAVGNAFVLPIAVLSIALTMGLPLVTAMVAADALAGESGHGTLRGWLLAPVSRGRLLAVKAFGVAVFAVTAAAIMALTGFVTGLVLNGGDALFTISGTTLTVWGALGKIAVAVGWVSVQLFAVGAVALAISACTEHPMIVVLAVLGGTVGFSVLGMLDALSWLHPFLLTESWDVIADVLRDPMPTGPLSESALRAICYLLIGLSLAYARLTTRDI